MGSDASCGTRFTFRKLVTLQVEGLCWFSDATFALRLCHFAHIAGCEVSGDSCHEVYVLNDILFWLTCETTCAVHMFSIVHYELFLWNRS